MNIQNFTYWDELCETYESHCGVSGVKKIVDLPFEFGDSEEDLLGQFFENVKTKSERGKKGQFFTPIPIVDYLIETSKFEIGQKIADISCGSGRFLLGVVKRLVREKVELKKIIESVYGADIDPILVRIAVANIRGYLAKNGYSVDIANKLHFEVKDSLENIDNLFSKKKNFDLVLGNPPYLKASPKNNWGHPNLYASFVEAGLDNLKTGGILAYIIPKSFVSGAYFKKLRDILQNKVETRELITLIERNSAFNKVLQEQILLVFKNVNPNKDHEINVGNAFMNGGFVIDKFSVPRESVFWNKKMLCLPKNKLDYQIFKKCFLNGFKNMEESGLRVSTGHIVPFRVKDRLSSIHGRNHRALYWPHNIKPFQFKPQAKAKNRECAVLDCDELKSYKLSEPVVAIKRISAKEQSRRIEAALINNKEEYFLENHLNFLWKKSSNAPSLKIMELLLNSKLWDYLFRLINGNTQVSAYEMNIFPLPHGLEEFAEKVPDDDVSYSNEMLEKLEQKIHSLYGLTREESKVILEV